MASFREQQSQERFEKRKIPRFPVQLPVELGYGGEDLASICTNLSSEGVSIETACQISVGERLSIRVTIAPEEDPLRMMGQVIWKREIGAVTTDAKPIHEIGVRFLRPLPSPWKTQNEPEYSADPTGEEEIPELPPMPL
ncbi:MAG: PilZ domain-containing protein [Pseudomonadota bacterium]